MGGRRHRRETGLPIDGATLEARPKRVDRATLRRYAFFTGDDAGRTETTTCTSRTSCTSCDGVAWITLNRPEKMNAFRALTCDELIRAFNDAAALRTWATTGRILLPASPVGGPTTLMRKRNDANLFVANVVDKAVRKPTKRKTSPLVSSWRPEAGIPLKNLDRALELGDKRLTKLFAALTRIVSRAISQFRLGLG